MAAGSHRPLMGQEGDRELPGLSCYHLESILPVGRDRMNQWGLPWPGAAEPPRMRGVISRPLSHPGLAFRNRGILLEAEEEPQLNLSLSEEREKST